MEPVYKESSLLHQKYVEEGLSASQIASHFVCSKATVQKELREAGIAAREPHHHHGHPSQPKYGERVAKGKTTAHLGEHRVVQTVFEMRDQGLSLRQIARFLSQIGVPTKQRGKAWHPERVRRVLATSDSMSIEVVTDERPITSNTSTMDCRSKTSERVLRRF